MLRPDRLSIEVTNACSKACSFCYNRSHPGGATRWTVDDLLALIGDAAHHGVQAVSFGGGEPLEFPGLIDLLGRLEGLVFRSLTTNGLLLSARAIDALAEVRPDKVHISVHQPFEVERVIGQVRTLEARGIPAGVNLLVRRSRLDETVAAGRRLRDSGIARIVYLPMRGQDTPSPAEVARVAGSGPFQSMSCLNACGASPRFASIGWDRTVAWCSYTTSRRSLSGLDYRSLCRALDGLPIAFCGGGDLLVPAPVAPPPRRPIERARDVPAAHSMDTDWFAIDADGTVAIFFSGEGGAVPVEGALLGDGPGEGDIRSQAVLQGILASAGLKVRRADWLAAEATHIANRPAPSKPGIFAKLFGRAELSPIENYIAFVDHAEPALRAQVTGEGGAVVLVEEGGAMIFAPIASVALVRAIHQQGCRGCGERSARDHLEVFAKLGLYVYECPEQWAIPYQRRGSGRINVRALPDALRSRLEAALRFPFRFADREELQPPEHVRSEAWGPEWGGTDRRVRAFVGREADFAGMHAELEELYGDEYQIDPPD